MTAVGGPCLPGRDGKVPHISHWIRDRSNNHEHETLKKIGSFVPPGVQDFRAIHCARSRRSTSDLAVPRPRRPVRTSAPDPPSPTLTRSARGCTRSQYPVDLYTVRGIRCTGRSRTDECCPRTTSPAFPRRRVVLASRLRQLPARPTPTTSSTNPLPGCVYRARGILSPAHPPSAELPPRSQC